MLPIGDICNLKGLIFSFLKLLRDMVSFQMLLIGELISNHSNLRQFIA